MEFLNGGSLEWNLKQKPFKEKKVIFYSAQLLCAILFLHSKQIIHRDIKLENILLDSNGNAKLGDFSLCIKMTHLTAYKDIVGTALYKSPESFKTNYLNYSTDFWAFGVCVYRMFTGQYPFENKNQIKDDTSIPDLNETRKLYLLVPSIFSSPILNNKYSVSEISCDFVSRLLNKNLNERLGNKENNEYIKNEPFFSSIDWNKLENGQLEPPINPKLVYEIYFFIF